MIQVFIMNSFATTPEGGNPAGVVLRSDFSEKEMLKIASIAGFSETAFLNRVDGSKSDFLHRQQRLICAVMRRLQLFLC